MYKESLYIETHRKFRNCYSVVFVFGMHLNTKEYLIDVLNCYKKNEIYY